MAYHDQWGAFGPTATQIIHDLIPTAPYAWAKVRSVDDGEFAHHFVQRCHELGHATVGLNGKRGTHEKSRDAVAVPNATGCRDLGGTWPGLQVIDFVVRHETPSARGGWQDVTVNPATGQFYTDSRWLGRQDMPAQAVPPHRVNLTASLFWLMRGYRDYRAQLTRCLQNLKDADVETLRMLVAVGGHLFAAPDGTNADPWEHMGFDCSDPDHESILGESIDFAFSMGFTTQATLLGSIEQAPNQSTQDALVDRCARVFNARPHMIARAEMMNEYGVNGGDLSMLHRMLARLKSQCPWLPCGLSSPNATHFSGATYEQLRDEIRAMVNVPVPPDFIPIHSSRGETGLFGPGCCREFTGIPEGNNEPEGPGSSGSEAVDADEIASDYLGSVAAQHAYYVFHSALGFNGAKLGHDWPNPPGHFDEIPGWANISTALKTVKNSTYTWIGAGGSAPVPVPTPPLIKSTLLPGERLLPEQSTLKSPNGKAHFHYQADGNTVIYFEGQPIWSSQSAGIEPGYWEMGVDGHFVMYDTSGNPRRATHTWGHPGAMGQLQDDGHWTLYEDPKGPLAGTPIWDSATSPLYDEHAQPA